MIKFKIFFDIEKEEQWLNHMLSEGWVCANVISGGFYTFKKTDNLERVIRIDFQQDLKKEERTNYKQLYEDFGWQSLKEKSYDGSYYWLKRKDGNDELFSDNDSQIAKYKRLMKHSSNWAIIFFIWLMMFYSNDNFYPFNIKDAYFTPGLWDKEGFSFVFSFLFETPLAIMRFIVPWLFFITFSMYVIMYFRYRQSIQQYTE
ncbi:DUF2812 domain-containing protein [Lysinibacillus sp. Bpr_S20]|uniref:DUF2812 domain-containing protein n=1 Tax=Lysinibacillus sp. Bpr_S20 TaxID=2933964 RepID=UPI002013BCEA|nr:DUF2812 domain-containing protein [Lysinibacillus sp. Bpr_S20]MCL1700384.1 DUF2812 domain-containing protein [Lysinibacillus sp. Bpr_S20]